MKPSPSKLSSLGISFFAAMAAFAGLLILPTAFERNPAPPRASSRMASLATLASTPAAVTAPSQGQLVEMTVEDVLPISEAQTHVVMLLSKDASVVLPVFVDEEAAIAIAFRLAHRETPSPMSADLAEKLVSDLGGKVTEVRIEEMDANAYRGRVLIEQGDKKLQVSAAPSDSIALALSSGARILVSEKVMSESGITQRDLEALKEMPGLGGSGPEEEGRSQEQNLPSPERPGHGPEITL